jgi:hypothetical protein
VKGTDLAVEWNKMMLAHSVDLNVLHNDHLIMSLVEQRPINDVLHILLVSLCVEQHSKSIPLRCIQDTLPVGILAYALQHRAHRTRHLLQSLSLARRGLFDGETFPRPCRGAG